MSEPLVTHIVVSEDNPADVLLLEIAVKEHAVDCKLLAMRDGEEALQFFRKRDADSTSPATDLLLHGLHLPKRDGEEIMQRFARASTLPGRRLSHEFV